MMMGHGGLLGRLVVLLLLLQPTAALLRRVRVTHHRVAHLQKEEMNLQVSRETFTTTPLAKCSTKGAGLFMFRWPSALPGGR